MVVARQALTSHLGVNPSHGTVWFMKRWGSHFTRNNGDQPRRTSFDEARPLRDPYPSIKRLVLHSPTKNKLLQPKQRKQLLDNENFIPWLLRHLEHLIGISENDSVDQKQEDSGFATFLRNLIPILKSSSTKHALSKREARESSKDTHWRPSEQPRPLSLFKTLKEAFAANGSPGVNSQLRYSYRGLLAGRAFSKVDVDDQTQLADLRYPMEWYPATREIQRSLHLHVGPTNSGKTYHALKRLEQSTTGLYAGPLRLLAHEVYTRLNAMGKTCDLVTGDEQRFDTTADGPRMISCTVEMVPLNTGVDVAVIDEIQMIGDQHRGWAWTQALLGVKAKELHLCGEARTVPLIRELAASMGDSLEIHTYERLSPLKTLSTSLQGDLRRLRKGDCVVVFSRVGIHAMKNQIERMTGKRVAIVYGSLPPEIRAQQAALFNDPNNDYDILVASDAIGMGLNLAIKRIVFETITKYNGASMETISASQIKQIAGRAGRYRMGTHSGNSEHLTANGRNPTAEIPLDPPSPLQSNFGLVTTLEQAELFHVRDAMQNEAEPLMTAGLLPPMQIIEDFARYFPPSVSFSYILLRLQELSRLHPRYHLCLLNNHVDVADAIQPVEGLSVLDRLIFCAAPVHVRDREMPAIVIAYARCVANNSTGKLLDIPEIPLEVLDEEVRLDRNYMRRLESLHKALILYLWLGYRYYGMFVDREMAFYVKKLTEEKIDAVLQDFSASPAVNEQIKAMKQKALLQVQKLNEARCEPEDHTKNKDSQSDEHITAPKESKAVTIGGQDPGFDISELGSMIEDQGQTHTGGSTPQ